LEQLVTLYQHQQISCWFEPASFQSSKPLSRNLEIKSNAGQIYEWNQLLSYQRHENVRNALMDLIMHSSLQLCAKSKQTGKVYYSVTGVNAF
jgi:hypothetical protein